MKHVIHTSERSTFKRCRQLFDFTSPNRQGLESTWPNRNLRFGTAIHKGLEVHYDPATWPNAPLDAVVAAFATEYPFPGDRETASEDELAAWQDDLALGTGMLAHYVKWYSDKDNFTPLGVEVKFELPIKNLSNLGAYYAGKIDLILQDRDGLLWLADHKTASRFGGTDWLSMDDQCGSYLLYAQKVTGKQFAGIIYNELLKEVPHPPRVLKNGKLSVDKNQNTTFDLYLTAIRENGYDTSSYVEILNHLRESGNKFFRRTQVSRSQRELEILEDRIAVEVSEMLRPDLAIYPTPSQFNCSSCDFKAPCQAIQDGSDFQYVLDDLYRKREED